MFNLGYKKWLVPYIEGSLDERRRAILEYRMKGDTGLAEEVAMLRRMALQFRESASVESARFDDENYLFTERRSIWPRVESAIQGRRPVAVLSPRFALAGTSLAVVLIFGALYTTASNRHAHMVALQPPGNPSAFNTPYVAPTAPGAKAQQSTSVVHNSGHRATGSPNVVDGHVGFSLDKMPELAVAFLGRIRSQGMPSGSMIAASFHGQHKLKIESRLAPPSMTDTAPEATTNNAPPAPPITERVADNSTGSDTKQDVLGYSPVERSINPSFLVSAGFGSPFVDRPDESVSPPVMPGASGGGKVVMMNGFDASKPRPLLAAGEPVSIDGLRKDALDVTNNRNAAIADKQRDLQADRSLGAAEMRSKLEDLSDLYAKKAVEAWRDALEFTVVPSTQDPSTSEQVDDTLRMVRSAGYLPQLSAMMESECNMRPNEIAGWRILGHLYALEGYTDRAAAAWLHAANTDGAVGEDWYQLGQADEAVGSKSDAFDAYTHVTGVREKDAIERIKAINP